MFGEHPERALRRWIRLPPQTTAADGAYSAVLPAVIVDALTTIQNSPDTSDTADTRPPPSDTFSHLPDATTIIPTPLVSVVIVNYNGKKFLSECIESLYAQSYPDFEILVVDNASVDGSIEFLTSGFPAVRIIRNPANLGFAGGMNAGILDARGPFILALNNDTRMDRDCIKRLVDVMVHDHSIGMCAAKLLFYDQRINSTGICISRSGAAWDRGMFEADTGQFDTSEEVFGPSAAAALYRREMFDDIGLFDKDFFLYMEDVDIAFRGQLAGWKCIYIPEAVVYHYHGGTAGFQSDLTVYYGNRNILWIPFKNYPLSLLLSSLPWIIGRTIGVIPYYAVRGQGKIILRSKIDGVRGILKMIKKRRTVKRGTPIKGIMKFLYTWAFSNNAVQK
jgi:GT2 family glycosyltransferase